MIRPRQKTIDKYIMAYPDAAQNISNYNCALKYNEIKLRVII